MKYIDLTRLLYYLPMERMNYINKDKNNMTDAERIRYLEESIRELRKEKENLKKEKGELKLRLEEENKKLKHENSYRAGIVDILPKWKGHIAEETIQDLQVRIKELSEENQKLKEELRMLKEWATLYREDNKKLRKTIKDHQLYEEKLEHRIIEFEELLHWE